MYSHTFETFCHYHEYSLIHKNIPLPHHFNGWIVIVDMSCSMILWFCFCETLKCVQPPCLDQGTWILGKMWGSWRVNHDLFQIRYGSVSCSSITIEIDTRATNTAKCIVFSHSFLCLIPAATLWDRQGKGYHCVFVDEEADVQGDEVTCRRPRAEWVCSRTGICSRVFWL